VPLIFAKGPSPGTFKSAFAIKKDDAKDETQNLQVELAAPSEQANEETKQAPASEVVADKVEDVVANNE